jgi:hypothetical protein
MRRTFVGGRACGVVAVGGRLGLETLETLAKPIGLASKIEHSAVLLLNMTLQVGELLLETAK